MKSFFLILALGVAGCATPIADQQRSIQSVSPFVASVNQMKWLKLEINMLTRIELAASSPSFDAGGVKSHFAAVELPHISSRAQLVVGSFFNGRLIGQYFEPTVRFLDAELSQVHEIRLDSEFVDSTWKVKAHMVGDVHIPMTARYALLFTDRSGASGKVAYVRGGGVSRLSYGLEGELIVEVRSTEPNQTTQHNAGSRPFSSDSSASETPSVLGPRG